MHYANSIAEALCNNKFES